MKNPPYSKLGRDDLEGFFQPNKVPSPILISCLNHPARFFPDQAVKMDFVYFVIHPMVLLLHLEAKLRKLPVGVIIEADRTLRGWEVQKPLKQSWNRLKMIWASLQLNRSLFSLLAPVELFFFGLRSLGGQRWRYRHDLMSTESSFSRGETPGHKAGFHHSGISIHIEAL